MKILLDECTPRLVKKRLSNYFVSTVQEMGWQGIKNGNLLEMADGMFEVMITTDKNLPYQQNLGNKRLSVIILPDNSARVVSKLIPLLEEALKEVQPGTFVEIPL